MHLFILVGEFTAAAQCRWDWLKINYSAQVHRNEGACHTVHLC